MFLSVSYVLRCWYVLSCVVIVVQSLLLWFIIGIFQGASSGLMTVLIMMMLLLLLLLRLMLLLLLMLLMTMMMIMVMVMTITNTLR